MIITSTTIAQMCSKLAVLSSNQAGLATSDFLSIANLVISVLVSELLAAREEYLVYQETLPVVAGVSNVRLPYRAVNGELRHLWFEDATGARTRLDARNIEDMENYNANDTGPPDGFYIRGNQIVLMPPPSANGSLVVAYPFRPNQLVETSTTQSIASVNNNIITVPNMPSNFLTGSLFDIIDHTSGNSIVYYDQFGVVSGNSITFVNNVGQNAVVGNYVCLANQSPVPMMPEEGHSVLLETTILRLEMVRGSASRIKNSGAVVQDARKAWDLLLMNRVVSKAKSTGNGGQQFPLRPW